MTDNWEKISIRKELLNRIEKFLKTKEAKRLGYTNPTQLLDRVLSNKLDEFPSSRFEHFNFADDIVRVLDNEIGKMGDIVELRKKNTQLACGYCESMDCVHVKFVWSDPDLVKVFEKVGLKNPF